MGMESCGPQGQWMPACVQPVREHPCWAASHHSAACVLDGEQSRCLLPPLQPGCRCCSQEADVGALHACGQGCTWIVAPSWCAQADMRVVPAVRGAVMCRARGWSGRTASVMTALSWGTARTPTRSRSRGFTASTSRLQATAPAAWSRRMVRRACSGGWRACRVASITWLRLLQPPRRSSADEGWHRQRFATGVCLCVAGSAVAVGCGMMMLLSATWRVLYLMLEVTTWRWP